MLAPDPEPSKLSVHVLAHGPDWRITEVTCRAGPADRPYEEQHEWTSIAAVLSGTFTYRSTNGRALLAPGSMLLGPAGVCFQCGHQHGRGDRCIAFQFAPNFMEETTRDFKGPTTLNFRNVRIPPLAALLPMFSSIRALKRAPDPLHAESLALSVASTTIALDQDATEASPSLRDDWRIAQAVRFMEAHYAEPLTIAGLANLAGLRRRRFASVFRSVMKLSPYQYLLNLRLNAAAQRLERDTASVLDIALDAGFGDLSEFTRRFRARFGRPPGQYRRGVGRGVERSAGP